MRKMILGCIGAAAIAVSSAANASITFDITGPSGTFGDENVYCDAGPVGCAGAFTSSGTFSVDDGYHLVNATISTTATTPDTNIDFGTVLLNGVAFDLSPDGVVEFGSVLGVPLQAVNTLQVIGSTGGAGAFSGTLAFAQAVPEPGTWAMMLLGFGAIGAFMRRRKPALLPQIA